MQNKIKLIKGDPVMVISGKDKGKVSEILQVLPKKQKVLVKDVNIVVRHSKPTQTSAGGKIEKEMPVDVSNVAYYDKKMSKPSKIGYKFEDGKKVRYIKSSNDVI